MNTSETGRLIKAHTARHLGGGTAFNFDDLRRQCEQHVADARRQAGQILVDAGAQAAEIRQRAQAEGHAAGEAAGLAAARDLIESRAEALAADQTQRHLRGLLPAVEAVVRALEVERDAWLTAWEASAIRLSARIASKILRHELDRQPELAGDIVREALKLAAGSPQIQVRLHPEDLAHLGDFGEQVVELLTRLGEGALVPDGQVSRGGCVVETRHGVIDARLETQIDRITHELIGTE